MFGRINIKEMKQMGIETITAEAQASINNINKEIEKTEEESRNKKAELNEFIKSFEKKVEALRNSRKRFELIMSLSDPDKNINKVMANKGGGRKPKEIEEKKIEETNQNNLINLPKKKQGRPRKVVVTEEVSQ